MAAVGTTNLPSPVQRRPVGSRPKGGSPRARPGWRHLDVTEKVILIALKPDCRAGSQDNLVQACAARGRILRVLEKTLFPASAEFFPCIEPLADDLALCGAIRGPKSRQVREAAQVAVGGGLQ